MFSLIFFCIRLLLQRPRCPTSGMNQKHRITVIFIQSYRVWLFDSAVASADSFLLFFCRCVNQKFFSQSIGFFCVRFCIWWSLSCARWNIIFVSSFSLSLLKNRQTVKKPSVNNVFVLSPTTTLHYFLSFFDNFFPFSFFLRFLWPIKTTSLSKHVILKTKREELKKLSVITLIYRSFNFF